MLHPSYNELMAAINEQSDGDSRQQLVSSRYSIVIAAAKRARQIINQENAELELEQEGGSVQSDKHSLADKPLSIAIRELMNGEVKILPDDGEYDEDYFGAEAIGDVMYEPGDADDYTEFNDDSTERYDEYEDGDEFSDDTDSEDLDHKENEVSDDDGDAPLDEEF